MSVFSYISNHRREKSDSNTYPKKPKRVYSGYYFEVLKSMWNTGMKLRLSVAVGVGVLAATFAGLLFHLFLKKCCALRMATRLRFRIAVVASILVGVGVSISAAKSSRRLRPDPLVLQQDRRFYDGNSGACAVVCHLDGANLTTAWAGDCRAILGVKSPWTILRHDLKADELTRDHQISTNPEERARLIRDHPGEVDVVHRNRVKCRGGWSRHAHSETENTNRTNSSTLTRGSSNAIVRPGGRLPMSPLSQRSRSVA
mmetsp:Transcript_8693/g.21412  ORF Transcript_8693/g.21412 Transcript_8693/m.21412 type:complete len:257 (-) Transcript_8693:869-1639(-)